MDIFLHEFMKVFTKRSVLVFLVIAISINGILLYRNENKGYSSIKPSSYKEVYKDLASMSDEQKYEFLKEKVEEFNFYMWMQSIEDSQGGGIPMIGGQGIAERYGDKVPIYTQRFAEGNMILYTENYMLDYFLFNELYKEITQVMNYDEYLKDIEERAKHMIGVSVFSKPGTFSYRNIIKTADDFKRLEGNVLNYDISKGVHMATGFDLSDLITLLTVIIICIQLILIERERGLFALVKPTYKGRLQVILSKIGVLFVSCLFITACIYGTNFLIAGHVYGFGDTSRLIQSLSGFIGSGLEISLGTYFTIFLLTKLAVSFFTGLIVLLFCLTLMHYAAVYLCTISIFGVSYLLYRMIPPSSALNIFKYVNLVYFIDAGGLYSQYLNINLFGYPVNIIPVFLAVCGLGTGLLIYIVARVFCLRKIAAIKPILPGRLIQRFNHLIKRHSAGLLAHEAWKIFIMNKALAVIAIFLFIQLVSFAGYEPGRSMDDFFYRGFMTKLSGEMTEEKEAFLDQTQMELDNALTGMLSLGELYQRGEITDIEYHGQSRGFQEVLRPQTAFRAVMERREYISEQEIKTGEKLWFIYDTGLDRLTASRGYRGDLTLGALACITLIACFSGVFAGEYSSGAIKMIRSCPEGRGKTFMYKSLICLATVIPIFAITYLPDLINTFHYFGTDGLNGPVRSLPHLSGLPFDMTVAGYLVWIHIIRFIGFISAALLVLFVSGMSGSSVNAMLISTGLVLIPCIAGMLGMRLIEGILLNGILSGNMIFQRDAPLLGITGKISIYIKSLVPLALSAVACVLNYRKFCVTGRRG